MKKQAVRTAIFACVFFVSQWMLDMNYVAPPNLLDLLLVTAIATIIFGVLLALADRFMGDKQ